MLLSLVCALLAIFYNLSTRQSSLFYHFFLGNNAQSANIITHLSKLELTNRKFVYQNRFLWLWMYCTKVKLYMFTNNKVFSIFPIIFFIKPFRLTKTAVENLVKGKTVTKFKFFLSNYNTCNSGLRIMLSNFI